MSFNFLLLSSAGKLKFYLGIVVIFRSSRVIFCDLTYFGNIAPKACGFLYKSGTRTQSYIISGASLYNFSGKMDISASSVYDRRSRRVTRIRNFCIIIIIYYNISVNIYITVVLRIRTAITGQFSTIYSTRAVKIYFAADIYFLGNNVHIHKRTAVKTSARSKFAADKHKRRFCIVNQYRSRYVANLKTVILNLKISADNKIFTASKINFRTIRGHQEIIFNINRSVNITIVASPVDCVFSRHAAEDAHVIRTRSAECCNSSAGIVYGRLVGVTDQNRSSLNAHYLGGRRYF